MKLKVILILMIAFLAGISTGIGHPVTPTYVKYLELPDYIFGIFFSIMSVGLLIGSPIFGRIGDQYGKKKFIVLSFIGYAIGQYLFTVSNNPYFLVFVRLISGLFIAGQITLLPALLIEHVSKVERTKYLSIFTALTTLGASTAYKIGGYLGTIYIKEVFYFQTSFTIFVGVLALLLLPTDGEYNPKTKLDKQNAERVHYSYGFILFLVMLFIVNLAHINTTKFLDVYMIDSNYTSNDLGNMAMVMGLITMFTNFFIVPYLSRLKKDYLILKITILVAAVMVYLTFTSENLLFGLYTYYIVFIMARSIFTPIEQAYISKQAEHNQGQLMGLRQATLSLGNVVGPLIGGYVYSFSPMIVFYGAVILFIIAFIFSLFVQKKI